jgi:alpha-D-ribose 1-methylphosphonate 5-triphosphate diphosphatase
MQRYLTHAHLVLPDRELRDAALLIEDGLIAAIAPESGGAAPEFDCAGATVIPGLVDLHCDALEKEIAPRPKVLFPMPFAVAQIDRRNAMAGITTPFHAISFAHDEFGVRDPAIAAETVRALRAHRGMVDNRVHCRYEITDASSHAPLVELVREGAMDLLSLMDHTPGQGQFKSLDAYERYMVGAYQVSVAQAQSMANAKLAARTGAAERVHELVELARAAGIPLASHDDDSVERIAALTAMGARMSEFPINLETATAAHRAGLATILGAPNVLRGKSQSGSMRALDGITAGVADCLCSDYHPATLIEALFRLPELAGLPLHAAVRIGSANPARAAGLADRGEIAVGRRADLVAVRRAPEVVTVEATLVRGRVVLDARSRRG